MFPMLFRLEAREKAGDTRELLTKSGFGKPDRRRHGAWQMSSHPRAWQTHFSGYETFYISATVEAAGKGLRSLILIS